MNLGQSALILEGGGMRGVYTAGVLRYFMDRNLYLPYVIGASMGACNGANYVAHQPERNRIVNIRYANESRFISTRRLLWGGELFGMGFIFDTIPNVLVPFDFETFMNSEQRFIAVVFDCQTGETVYIDKTGLTKNDLMNVLRAGSSLPLVQKPVSYKGHILMDGGLADPVPIQKSLTDGNLRHVLVLTQPKGFRKKTSDFAWLIRRRYRHFEGLCRGITQRQIHYNETMKLIDRMEEKKEIFVIRPQRPLKAGRIERNKDKLYADYDQGYSEASACYDDLCAYLNP
ncbi:MAG: patatin family protein [Syntrophales bacterium LBB04]|nr:patatin family protein [Syntrophales bacterium LBB04]